MMTQSCEKEYGQFGRLVQFLAPGMRCSVVLPLQDFFWHLKRTVLWGRTDLQYADATPRRRMLATDIAIGVRC
jgi:hypothetical protein